MLALTLSQAKTIAVSVVVALLVLAIASAWFMKKATQKIALVTILGLLAFVVWTQRASLEECSENVRADVTATCSFFGQDVQIDRSTGS